ncbi:MAG: acyl-CoA reductase [archaeon]|nr:acyl-CoA reductase [archaeon]
MINLAIFGGEFYYPEYKSVESLVPLMNDIEQAVVKLRQIKKSDLLNLFQEYSRVLIKDPESNTIEGVPFLSNWLRKTNFSQIIEKNLKSIDYLEQFVGEKKRIKAQPRGLACHWIAGNVPTIGIFSLFQSIFVGNANILRIPPISHDIICRLLKVFSKCKLDNGISGSQVLKSVGIIYFEKDNNTANNELSNIADVRIVWGGSEAIKAITGLEKADHCEDVVFGPKYSFSVFDKEAIESAGFNKYIRNLIADVLLFDQAACTSPHTVFFEKKGKQIEEITQIISEEFNKMSKKFPKTEIDQFITTKIINERARYALDPEKIVICPKENDWTILINNKIQLEEPIESRTIFIKEIDSIMDTIPLITRKIQTIGCAVENKDLLIRYANQVTLKGVSRCVNLGQMHLFDSPWDGMLFLSRLVNWVTLYYGKE